MTYEEILNAMDEAGLEVREMPLRASDGLIKGNKVAIRKSIRTSVQKAEVAAEEFAHHLTASGNIKDYSDQNSWKVEMKGRRLSFDLMIGLSGLVKCYEQGCRSLTEAAECLDVTPKFLTEAIDYYHGKHGRYVRYAEYMILFEPSLSVCKMLEV